MRRFLLAACMALPVGFLLGTLGYNTYPEGAGRAQFAFLFGAFFFFPACWFAWIWIVVRAQESRSKIELVAIDITESVEVARPADTVWAQMEDPAFGMLNPACVSAARMPGTPHGVGEVQVFVHRQNDHLTLDGVEIVEYEPGRRARSRPLSRPSSAEEIWTDWNVESLGPTRCRATIAEHALHRVHPSPAADQVIARMREQLAARARESLSRLADDVNATN